MLLLIAVGWHFGGENGMILAFVISVAMNFTAYFYSDKIALKMYNAQPVTREQLPRAYEVVERLTAKQGLPMPKIYVLPTESPNAFATGRNPQHASVAVTHGILGLLDDEELEGVLAHELGHVKNRDILTSSIAATLAGAITLAARMGYWAELFGAGGGGRRSRNGGGLTALLMIILAPIAAMLIQLAISRSREYEADATGAHVTGNPYALARALQEAGRNSTPSACRCRQRPPPRTSSSSSRLCLAAVLAASSPPTLLPGSASTASSAAISSSMVRMTFVLRALRLLAVVVWVGGIVFFAAVEAPAAFHAMGTTSQFALLIGNSVQELNHIGHACGFVFLFDHAIALWSRTLPSRPQTPDYWNPCSSS